MPYTKTSWVDGSAPAISASNLNKIETGIYDALRQDGTTAMSGQLVVTSGSATTPSIAASGDSNTGVFFPTADTIAFVEGGAEAMRINSSGNVGIGTTSPYKKLQINPGNAGAVASVCEINTLNADTTGILISNYTGSTGTEKVNIDFDNSGYGGFSIGMPASANAFSITDTSLSAERMRITSAGNVGIGTTSPTNKLHVTDLALFSKTNNGPNELIGTFIGSDGTYPVLDMRRWTGSGTDHGTGKISTTDAADMLFFTNQAASNTTATTERMRLTYNGYLLIGYTASNGAYPLQVNGQIFATSATIATSDKNYKENIKPLTDALTIVNALNPVSFDWKEHPVHNFDRTQPTIGFIAQEVAEVLKDKPYLDSVVKKSVCEWESETGETVEREVTREVTRDIIEELDGEQVRKTIIEEVTEVVTEAVKEKHTEEFYGIAESNLIAILTKAVQELSAEVKALKAQIK